MTTKTSTTQEITLENCVGMHEKSREANKCIESDQLFYSKMQSLLNAFCYQTYMIVPNIDKLLLISELIGKVMAPAMTNIDIACKK